MKPIDYKVPVNDAAWITSLAPNVQRGAVIKTVFDAVRLSLDGYEGPPLSTRQLVVRLWPDTGALPGYQRQRLFKTLMWLATRDLAAYCERGEERPMGRPSRKAPPLSRKMIRPWMWRALGEAHFEAIMPPTCPHCGGLL